MRLKKYGEFTEKLVFNYHTCNLKRVNYENIILVSKKYTIKKNN